MCNCPGFNGRTMRCHRLMSSSYFPLSVVGSPSAKRSYYFPGNKKWVRLFNHHVFQNTLLSTGRRMRRNFTLYSGTKKGTKTQRAEYRSCLTFTHRVSVPFGGTPSLRIRGRLSAQGGCTAYDLREFVGDGFLPGFIVAEFEFFQQLIGIFSGFVHSRHAGAVL